MSEPTTTAPVVDVVVTTDGTAQITVDGVSQELTAADVDAARRRSVAHIASTVATPAGGPVLAKVVDPDGSWHLLIHPDGTLGEAPTPSTPVSAPDVVDESMTSSPAPEEVAPAETSTTPAPAPTTPTTAAPPAPARSAAHPVSTDEDDETSAPVVPTAPAPRPSAQDLLGGRHARAVPQRAREGWRGWLVHEVGLPLAPSKAEAARFELTTRVQTQLPGPRTVMVVNPKGGVGKTTTTLLLSAALGLARGGGVLAWDNNETRGTMGLRSRDAGHGGTVRTLLAAAPHLTSTAGRLGDLDAHVHHQRGVRFDVLRSDEDPTGAGVVDAGDFAALHTLIQRFYRLVVVDTGNNIRSANWQAAAAEADQLVITTTVREDSGASAAWMVDALAAGPHAHLLERAVTVLSDPSPRTPEDERKRLSDHFAAATGGDHARVVRVPFDRALTGGGVIDHDVLSSPTRTAWLRVAAAVVDQLAPHAPAEAV